MPPPSRSRGGKGSRGVDWAESGPGLVLCRPPASFSAGVGAHPVNICVQVTRKWALKIDAVSLNSALLFATGSGLSRIRTRLLPRLRLKSKSWTATVGLAQALGRFVTWEFDQTLPWRFTTQWCHGTNFCKKCSWSYEKFLYFCISWRWMRTSNHSKCQDNQRKLQLNTKILITGSGSTSKVFWGSPRSHSLNTEAWVHSRDPMEGLAQSANISIYQAYWHDLMTYLVIAHTLESRVQFMVSPFLFQTECRPE